jgi:hypothetical protein
MNNITPEDIIAIIGVLGTLGAVFLYFRVPQEDLNEKQIVTSKDLDNKATILAQKEMENKAALLAQQVESEKVSNEKKFAEMNLRLDGAILNLQKDIRDVEAKVDNLVLSNTHFHFEMSNKITEMSTLIKERLPPSSVQFLPSNGAPK